MDNKLNQKRINLIPQEMAVPATAVKTAKLLNKISTVAVIILILLSLLIAGLFIYFSNQDKTLTSKITSMKTKLTQLQSNEQKLILAKDRLTKIKNVQKAKSVNNEIGRFKSFSEMVIGSGSIITEANLNSKGTEVSLLSSDSNTLATVLKPLATLSGYKTIVLTSLGYNAGTGFISTLMLSNE